MMDKVGFIYCVSCQKRLTDGRGKAVCSWGHSHNLSVGQYPEFELVKENIQPRCNVCHDKLDSGNIHKISSLPDFNNIMKVRKKLSKEAYNLTIVKLDEAGIKHNYRYETDY